MSNARKQYLKILEDAANFRGVFKAAQGGAISYAADQVFTFDPDFRFNLESTGFSKNKWDSLVYSYVEPRSFDQFIASCGKAKPWREVGYTCPVFSGHASGNCLIGFTFNGTRLRAYSRVCLWMPTGTQDLALLTRIAQKIKAKSIEWHLSSVKLTIKSLPSLVAMGIDGKFIDKNRHQLKSDGYGSHKAKRFLARGGGSLDGNLPSIDVYKEFLMPDVTDGAITPDTLAALRPGLRGVEIRNFLRDNCLMKKWGYANFYVNGEAYRWRSYNDPMVKLILAKFKLKGK